eukprot:5091120-Pyramimonas_sp.AAC.1
MLLKPPPDGLEGVPDGGALIAQMPVYGTRDAGRGAHVDDLLWAADDDESEDLLSGTSRV